MEVTFYSQYTVSDTYYRLRSAGESFHIASHPDGAYALEGGD